MDEIIDVHPDIAIFNVQLRGTEVTVDVYGGPSCVVGCIGYSVADPGRRRRLVTTLRKWRKAATALAYVHIGGDDGGRLVEMSVYNRISHPQ